MNINASERNGGTRRDWNPQAMAPELFRRTIYPAIPARTAMNSDGGRSVIALIRGPNALWFADPRDTAVPGRVSGVGGGDGVAVSVSIGLVFGVWPAIEIGKTGSCRSAALRVARKLSLIQSPSIQAENYFSQSGSFAVAAARSEPGMDAAGQVTSRANSAAHEQLGMAIYMDGQRICQVRTNFRQTFLSKRDSYPVCKGPRGIDAVLPEAGARNGSVRRRGGHQVRGEK